MSFISKFRCSKCGKGYPSDIKLCLCLNKDYGRLDVYYDYESIADALTRSTLEKRRPGVLKYKELLPIKEYKNSLSMGEGCTPLIRSKRLADVLDIKSLYIKNETVNPTGSFKDRVMSIGVAKAIEFGAEVTVTASSGNAAAALAAYSAKAGLDCYAFVIERAGKGKIAQLLLYGAKVVKVKEEKGVDSSIELLKKAIDRYGWYPCPSEGPFNPYQIEGNKLISYEIAEQMNWDTPDWIIVPIGAGSLLTGIWKGFKDFYKLGFIKRIPAFAGIQSTGNPPLVRAFKRGANPLEIKRWEHTDTIATGLADPYPWDGDGALTAIYETKGVAEEVTDEAILDGEKLLASKEGIFAEPSGVTSLAGMIKLLDLGVIDKHDTVVILITGSGLKDPEVATKLFGEPPTIKPTIEELEGAVGKHRP